MRRRDFMKLAGGGVLAAGLGAYGAAGADTQNRGKDTRPNVLVILADDMGFSDLGCYGSEIATPNLDALAGNGVRFTQFYCAARCCPSRASLLTGLYPHQAGMGGMVSLPDAPKPEGPYQGYLNDRCVTIAEAMKPAGYRTYMSGKWHVGERPEHWPRQRGFDRYFGLISGASSYYEILQGGRKRQMALEDAPFTPPEEGFYMTDAFTDYAVDCIDSHPAGEQPFFLYLAYTAPHWPLHALPEDIEKYRGKYLMGWDKLREQRHARMLELGIVKPEWPLSPRDPDVPAWDEVENKEEWAELMAVYAAMIDRLDQGVGRVVDALRRTGHLDNTLILFMADNGGCHENISRQNLGEPGKRPGERGSYVAYDRPWANASNTPFRMFKHWVHEGGIATPLIAHWPARMAQKGALTEQPGHIIDIMPTCLDLAGTAYPTTHNGQNTTPVEGLSLLPVLEGHERTPHDVLYWEHMGNRAVREGKWKLVAAKSEPWALYDVEADRTELNNLAGSLPDKAAELNGKYEAWAAGVGVAEV